MLINNICRAPAASSNRIYKKLQSIFLSKSEPKDDFLLGYTKDKKRPVRVPTFVRTMHTQVIGTTNAGKTASVILPWLVQDIEKGRGAIIIDGKADKTFLETLRTHIFTNNREQDFHLFSLANLEESQAFNPFGTGTPEQIAERAMAAFKFENEYYRNIQFQFLRTILALIQHRGRIATPFLVRELIRDKERLLTWAEGITDSALLRDIAAITEDRDEKRLEKVSGLISALTHFASGSTLPLFNDPTSEINLKTIIKEGKICYFQLPTMLFPFLGESTGKLILQNLQSAISELQVSGDTPKKLFSIYLDDFNDYIYPGFASILNKSRSANIGVIFSHQSLGDLEKVSPDFKQIVLTNTNIKIVMRSNDPDTAEHFAKMIGTHRAESSTRRRSRGFLGRSETGEESVREVEEFVFHPNVFKTGLGTGEAICILPHSKGSSVLEVKFSTVPQSLLTKLAQGKLISTKVKTIDLEAQLQIEKPEEKKK